MMNITFIISRLRTNRGYILLEVSVAIVIISLTLMPISTMFIQSTKVRMLASDYTMVANVAQQQLELLKTCPPDYWASLALPCVIPWQGTQLPSRGYTIITTAAATVDEHLVEVTVNASWQKVGQDYQLQFVTLYPTL